MCPCSRVYPLLVIFVPPSSIPPYDENGEPDYDSDEGWHDGFLQVTHWYEHIEGHKVESRELLGDEDISRCKVLLLAQELANIIYCAEQKDEYEYIESVFGDLYDQIDIGYNILEQYDDWRDNNE